MSLGDCGLLFIFVIFYHLPLLKFSNLNTMESMTTVVIDTNILIGASYDEFSHSKKIIDAVVKGELKAVASTKVLSENKLLLTRLIRDREYGQELESFFAQVELVRPARTVSVSDDPEDNKFINTALEGRAGYIITNDAHLLHIGEYEGIKIMRPKDFWYHYSGEQKSGEEQWREWMSGVMGHSPNSK